MLTITLLLLNIQLCVSKISFQVCSDSYLPDVVLVWVRVV